MTEEQEQRWGGDELDPEDLQIPEIKLIQATGGALAKEDKAKPGDFYATMTGDVIPGDKGFDLVVLRICKQRTYWGRTDILDEPPECASTKVTPGGGESIFGDDCSICEHRLEVAGAVKAEERRKKCTIHYNILGLVDNLPVVLRPSGLSAGATMDLYTQLKLNRQIRGLWYRVKSHVTSVHKTTSAGDAFAIRFGKLQLIEDEKTLEFNAEQAKALIGAQIVQIPESATPEATAETITPPATEQPAAVSASEVPKAKVIQGPTYEEVAAQIAAEEAEKKAEKAAEEKTPPPGIDMEF